MPDCNWRRYASIGALIALALTAALAVRSNYCSAPQRQQCASPDDKAAQEALAWLDTVRNLGKPEPSSKDSQDGKPNSEQYTTAYDLRAQWVTAIATGEMVTVGWIQIALSFAGLVALIWTIKLNRAAVGAAVRAAESAENSVAIARKTARRELRAYVSIKPKRIDNLAAGNYIQINLETRNHGQTPAFDINHDFSIQIIDCPLVPNFVWPIPTQKNHNFASLFPNDSMITWFNANFIITEKEIADIVAGKRKIHVWGATTYVDAFNKKRKTMINVSAGADFIMAALTAHLPEEQRIKCNWIYESDHNKAT